MHIPTHTLASQSVVSSFATGTKLVGKTGKYTVIIPKQAAVYSRPELDVTNEVIKQLNK